MYLPANGRSDKPACLRINSKTPLADCSRNERDADPATERCNAVANCELQRSRDAANKVWCAARNSGHARTFRMTTKPPLAPSGKLFVAIALVEALTWTGLLAGMYLKYVSGTTDVGVWLFGRLHGAAFLAYVVICFIAGSRLRWPMWALLLAVLAAIPPLVTWPLELWYRRRGLLSNR